MKIKNVVALKCCKKTNSDFVTLYLYSYYVYQVRITNEVALERELGNMKLKIK